MRQNPPTCQKSREEVLMENSFRTTEHFDDRDEQMIIFQEHQHHTSHLPTKLLPWPQNWKSHKMVRNKSFLKKVVI